MNSANGTQPTPPVKGKIPRTSLDKLRGDLEQRAKTRPEVDSAADIVKKAYDLLDQAVSNGWYLSELVADFRNQGIDIDEAKLERYMATAKKELKK